MSLTSLRSGSCRRSNLINLFEAERLRDIAPYWGKTFNPLRGYGFWGDALFSPNCIGGDEYSTLRVVNVEKDVNENFIQIFLNGSIKLSLKGAYINNPG